MELKKQLFGPLYIILGFNILTLLLFVIAPYDWSRGNPLLVIIYLLINYFFIFLGYRAGINKGLKRKIHSNKIFTKVNTKITSFIFIFYLLTFPIKYAYLLRFQFFDFSGMFTYLSIGFFDPQLGYNLSVEDNRPHTVSWFIFTLISIVNQLVFIFGFLRWRHLKFTFKVIFIFFLILELFYWFGRGTGFGVISLVTTFAVCFFIQQKSKKINLKIALTYFILFITVLFFYGSLKEQRAGNNKLDLQNFSHGLASVDENHYIFDIIPNSIKQTYMHSTSYLTQGYYHLGLSMSLKRNFTSTYLFGNNPATLNVANTFGVDLWKDTYMYKLKLESGVDDVGKWHSSYLWYANDVSFYGVPIIMFILSYFLSFAYVLILKFDDLLSKFIFVIILNMFIYSFANNTYLYHHFYSLSVILIIWYFTRVKLIKSNL